MRVLVTSGGTKVPIDTVRHIGNMSSGTFGSKIGSKILEDGHNLWFLTPQEGKTPLKVTTDLNGISSDFAIKEAVGELLIAKSYKKRYYEIPYRNFDEYAKQLEFYIKNNKFDIVILAAAVSDYIVKNPVSGKIHSSNKLTIELEPAQKLIRQVRSWGFNGILVGFKLLVGSTEDQLISAARKSVNENGCDMVVANDLNDIKSGNHKIMIVTKDNVYRFPKEEAVGALTNMAYTRLDFETGI